MKLTMIELFSGRNVSCMTMSVSAQGLERIISKIDLFRKEIVDIVRSDEGESMVCELNIQFFPLSKEKLALPPEADDGEGENEIC